MKTLFNKDWTSTHRSDCSIHTNSEWDKVTNVLKELGSWIFLKDKLSHQNFSLWSRESFVNIVSWTKKDYILYLFGGKNNKFYICLLWRNPRYIFSSMTQFVKMLFWEQKKIAISLYIMNYRTLHKKMRLALFPNLWLYARMNTVL